VSLRLKTSTPAPVTNPDGKEPDGYSYYNQCERLAGGSPGFAGRSTSQDARR
jgi:hypothetical protein